MKLRWKLFATAALVAVVFGCTQGRKGPERLRTVPVRGTVMVKGIPAAELSVRFKALAPPQGEAEIYAANPTALTEADGTFVVSTYERGDGLAAGEYVITFEWLKFNRISNAFGGPDRLKGKYSDPETSEFKLSVKGDEEAIVLDPFELTI